MRLFFLELLVQVGTGLDVFPGYTHRGRITYSFPEFEDMTQRHGMRPIVRSGNETGVF
jgi:hypothetical protein